jgi:hypothetical protein
LAAWASVAVDVGEHFRPFTFVAPILSAGEKLAVVEVLEHRLVALAPAAATEEWALELLTGRHLVAVVPKDGGPHDKPLAVTFIG